ncbi:MAG: polyphosphate kinase 2 [Chromatiales bacterium]|nr:polyphosphate kinase 2 [Chromatiales bacterium]
MNDKLKSKDYAELLEPLQLELNNLMHWLRHTGKRMVVLFEGRDTAGKGGVINAIAETLNPRQVRIVALAKPTERERTQWYFQRYVRHLPSAGELVLFDRSWYNRAGVERVMGFCTDAEYRKFLKEVPRFEQQLIDEGILLYKYWLAVDQKQQERRFAERAADPLKAWKLSPIDLEARKKYVEYGRARDRMLAATHSRHAPWTIVEFNDQKRGRLNLIRHLLDEVPDTKVPVNRVVLPRLRGKPAKERYSGPVRPIKGTFG